MIVRQLAALLFFLVTGIFAAFAQDSVFSVSTEEVRLDVLVTDKGKPVSGLKADDFEVFDNGIAQEIQYIILQKQTPVSVILVFDMSSSVAGELLFHLKRAASAILSDVKFEDHVALITFNNAVVLGSLPTSNFAFVRNALNQIQPFGNSALFDGTYAGLVLALSRRDPTLLIIFSDGRDTFSWLTDKAVLDAAKRSDAVVYAVSAGRQMNGTSAVARPLFEPNNPKPDQTFLSDLTKSTGGAIVKAEASEDLANVFRRILEEFRQRYTVTYTPRGVSESGWHKLSVRVKSGSVKVRARQGYIRSLSGSMDE